MPAEAEALLDRTFDARSEKLGRVRTCRLEPAPMRTASFTIERRHAQTPAR